MSRLSNSYRDAYDHTMAALKPVAIANGYYNELLESLDQLRDRVYHVHQLVSELRSQHRDHGPGPMSLCDHTTCRMADNL